MHDPLTLAFSCKLPFLGKKTVLKNGKVIHHRPVIFDIWHVDPESDGSDDSCGWFRPHLTQKEKEYCKDLVSNPDDNVRDWFAARSDWGAERYLTFLFRDFKRLHRPWWKHPRWHIHHWRIRVPLILNLKRFLFSRCAGCGKRFSWGYAPVTGQWHNKGPRWFRSEENIYHKECFPDP